MSAAIRQHVISTTELAALLGRDPSTVRKWLRDDKRLRACIIRQTHHTRHFSVQRLRDAGFLAAPAPVVESFAQPVLSYSWSATHAHA